MSETKKCPRCGAELPADAPEGLCPECLLKQVMKRESGPATTPHNTPFVAPSAEEIAKHFPQLDILEVLGQGGMGVVYKARQPGLDRLVALKILPPEVGRDPAFAERFTREARALAKLTHPGIVIVHDFGQTNGLYYFLMEFVDGVNLRQLLREGKLKPEEALKVVPQLCEALQFAHEEGVVHRDIKPENILLDKKGRVKIADFGLAKLLGQATDAGLTQTGQVMGTLHYMAPEQMEKPLAVDHRADIYSLGVVFYEMLTGELPLGRFAPPSQKVQVDVRLDEVVLRSLEREPERRWQKVSDVKTEVESITRTPAAVTPAVDPAMQPYQRALNFSMTPQPGYARSVGVPMLILVGIVLVAQVTIAMMVSPERELVQSLSLLLGWGLVGISFMGLHLRWSVKGRQTVSQAKSGPSSAAVPTPAGQRHMKDEEIKARVMPAGVCLAMVGVLQIAVFGCGLPLFKDALFGKVDRWAAHLSWPNEQGVLIWLLVSGVTGVYIMLGGVRLTQLRAYNFVGFSILVAMLPLTPVWLLSVPTCIWVLVILARPEVKAAFAQESR